MSKEYDDLYKKMKKDANEANRLVYKISNDQIEIYQYQ